MNNAQEIIEQLVIPQTLSDTPSCYAFSLHKSGSTLLFNILSELSPHAELAYFSLEDQLFANSVRQIHIPSEVSSIFRSSGFLYGGFRFYPHRYKIPDIEGHKKILLVRNPLDIMVSQYFSTKKSHILPKEGGLREVLLKNRAQLSTMSIDDFVKDKYALQRERCDSYNSLLSQPNLKIFRYEDIIYNKRQFVQDIVEHFMWQIPEDIIFQIADKYHEIPESENEDAHIRQVHPGNYKKHLSAEIQEFINIEFSSFNNTFGY